MLECADEGSGSCTVFTLEGRGRRAWRKQRRGRQAEGFGQRTFANYVDLFQASYEVHARCVLSYNHVLRSMFHATMVDESWRDALPIFNQCTRYSSFVVG